MSNQDRNADVETQHGGTCIHLHAETPALIHTRRLTCTRSHAQYTSTHAYMHAGVMMQQSKYRATVESNILQAMRCDCTLLHSHKHHDHHDRSNTAVSSRPLDLNFLFLCVLNMLMHASVRVCVFRYALVGCSHPKPCVHPWSLSTQTSTRSCYR